jgi:hypothetical protein
MSKTFKSAAVAVAIAGVSALSIASAYAADVVVKFDPNTVAYGYQDGYWTRTHEWHTWERPEHVEVYRKAPGVQYYEYAHTRDPDQGWRGEWKK